MKTEINDAMMYYEVRGAGLPVLMIHGFPLSGRLWAPCAAALKDRYRFILPDVRGLGRSEGHADASLARYADDLAALLDHLGVNEPAAVVGLSMGGYIAFEFYRRFPDRVRALVLADTRPEADPPQKKQERAALAEKVLKEGSRVVADGMLPQLFAESAPLGLKEEWRRVMADTPPEGVAAALRAMAERPDSTPTLSRITAPTLVVVGEHDAITPPDVARHMAGLIPGARLEIVPGSGHMTPVEHPDRFNALLDEFLKTL